MEHSLPEHPVLIIPPIDAPGAGSICHPQTSVSARLTTFDDGKGGPTHGKEERNAPPLELRVDVHPADARLTNQVRVFLCGATDRQRESTNARGADAA